MLFYYLSYLRIVRAIGAFGVLLFFISLWRVNRIMVVNRIAFHSTEFAVFPMVQKRKLLGLFRAHSESAEDRFFAALGSYCALIVLLSLTIHPWWLCVAAPLGSFCSFYALRRSWPGYALILGASNRKSTKDLAVLVQRNISPLFATNLLNMVTHNEIEYELFRATSYRLKNEVISWKSAVEVHAAFARLIVLDASAITDGVRAELQLLLECGFWYKTILLCPTEESRAVACRVLSSRPECLIVGDQDHVASAIQEVLKRFPAFPTPDVCLKQMIAPPPDA